MKIVKDLITELIIIVFALIVGIAPALAENENKKKDKDKEEYSIRTKAIVLNNEGVNALNNANYDKATSKFEEAIKVDPKYPMARSNYAIALNNYAITYQSKPPKALQLFDRALYYDFDNVTTKYNTDEIIRLMSLDPKNPAVRIDLGSKALLRGDLIGAFIEFRIATELCAPKAIEAKSKEDDK